MSKQIPELTIITTPTAGQESIIETVVARHDTYATSRMTLAQIFTLGSISGSIKVALDALTTAIWANTTAITTKLNTIGWTRTGLTANRALITDASGVETYLTGTTTQVIGFDGAGKPIAVTPTVDINGLANKAVPVAGDKLIISDSEASFANKNITLSQIQTPVGNGSDGALNISSWTTTLTFDASGYIEKNYTSFTMTGGTLAFSWPPTTGWVVVIKVSGNFSMTGSSLIDGSWMWAIGGGYPWYANWAWLPWSAWKSFLLFVNATNPWLSGLNPVWPTGLSSFGGYNSWYCWAGWGSWYIDANMQWLWWRGGACIYIEVGWSFTFTTPASIRANWAVWWTNNWGGGGGGGAWSVIIKAQIIITQSWVIQVNWWDGWSTLNSYQCAAGGWSYASWGWVTGGTNWVAGWNTAWWTWWASWANKWGGGGAGFYKIN